MTDEQLVNKLVQAAYNSGYYSGKHEDGQNHHVAAITLREKLRQEVLCRLKERTEHET